MGRLASSVALADGGRGSLLTDIGMLITILIKLGPNETEGKTDFAMFVVALIAAMLFP